MFDGLEIEDITCDLLSRDPGLRRQVLPALRKYFSKEAEQLRIKPGDDISLLRLSRAKYIGKPYEHPELEGHAEEEHRRLTCLNMIPDHVCSWIREHVKAQRLPALT